MFRRFRRPSRLSQGGLLALLAAAVGVAGPFPLEQPAAAQPVPGRAAPKVPTELQYVPADAALFLHADAASLWSGALAKSFRTADKAPFVKLEEAAKAFGVKINDLKSVAVFVPKAKIMAGDPGFGVAFNFPKGFDKQKLEDGVKTLIPKDAKAKLLTPSNTVAVLLVGLGDEFSKPQPADADGPLTAAIRAAASGKHTLVAGATLASLPDELQGDELPTQLRAFQPIFKAQSLTATVDIGKTLELSVQVKTKREALAVDAEKALAALAALIGDELGRELPDLEKDAAKDAGMKDLMTVFKAVLTAAKGAKFDVDGSEARLTATLPLADLPLASAYVTATTKVTGAAAAARSSNNLKQIALAMHNYESANDAFPPAAVCDKKSKPQLSWRVLILPYIEQNALYQKFKLDEPWDSENNKKLIDQMPNVYALPGSKPGTTETHYRVFVGNGAGFDWVTGSKILTITDGTSNTLMCVTAATAVTWTKPDELEFDPEKDMGKLIGFLVNGKAQVAMFDGSVRSLSKLPSKETVNALITKSGGEVIPNDF